MEVPKLATANGEIPSSQPPFTLWPSLTFNQSHLFQDIEEPISKRSWPKLTAASCRIVKPQGWEQSWNQNLSQAIDHELTMRWRVTVCSTLRVAGRRPGVEAYCHWPTIRRRHALCVALLRQSRASEDPISIFCWSCSFLVKPTCISQINMQKIMQNLHYDWIMYTYMSQWGWQALPTINKCIGSIPNSSVIRINYYLFWSYAGLFKGVSKRKPLHGLFC
jgi:hypothetical protein